MGATWAVHLKDWVLTFDVSILTHPEGWVQPVVMLLHHAEEDGVSILTHPEGWVQPPGWAGLRLLAEVSILTHPEGWVQPVPQHADGDRDLVSILTHPEGWVQPRQPARHTAPRGFNPHPPRRMGATQADGYIPPIICEVSILTHPEGWVQRTANQHYKETKQDVSILTHPEGWVQLASIQCVGIGDDAMFQSSPTPKDGCNHQLY